MTQINISTDIPSNITTLEQLAVWCGAALSSINPTITAIEGVGYTERVCQFGTFFIQADNKHRALIRQSVHMNVDYISGSSKIWMYANEFSNTALPQSFREN